MNTTENSTWVKVFGPEGLPDGRVTTVTAGTKTLALTRHEGQYGALDNACPHQGGPLTEVVPEDAVLAVDVGNNTYSFGRYFESSGRQSVLMSGYLGSIGFGFPAAMGAWAAVDGKRPVWCVSGDGGFGQYMGEVLTAVKYGMNITHVLLHNDNLGKITKEQRAGQFPVWKTDLHNPDFSKYYQICGAWGRRVEDRADLADAMREAAAHDGPAVVEVMSDADLV